MRQVYFSIIVSNHRKEKRNNNQIGAKEIVKRGTEKAENRPGEKNSILCYPKDHQLERMREMHILLLAWYVNPIDQSCMCISMQIEGYALTAFLWTLTRGVTDQSRYAM